jgi:hypothetical protein
VCLHHVGWNREEFEIADALGRFEDAGVTRVVFEIGTSPLDGTAIPVTANALSDNLERVAHAVLK